MSSLPSSISGFIPNGQGLLAGYTGPAYPNTIAGRDVKTERDEIDIQEVPAVIWRDEYDTDHTGLYKQIQHISDFMLARGPMIYSNDNPNTRKCRDVYEGRTDPADYDTATNTFGQPGVAVIKDWAFLYTIAQRIIGGKLQMPFQFDVKDASTKARDKKLEEMVDKYHQQIVRYLASTLEQKSQADGTPADFSMLKNPNVNPDAPVGGPTLAEKTLNALLHDTVLRYNTMDELRRTVEDKIQLNAQAVHIVVEGSDVYPVRVDLESLSCIASGKIRTAEDCSAIGIAEYLPVTTILEKYGHLFGSKGLAKNLTDTVIKLRGGNALGYQPKIFQLQDGRNNLNVADHITSTITGEGYQQWETTNWQEKFYPAGVNEPNVIWTSEVIKVLVHTLYFRVIKEKVCKVTINGRTPTTKEWDAYLHRNYDRKMDITLTPYEKGQKPKSTDFTDKKPFTELWQAKRLGHNTLIDVGKCTFAPPYIKQPRQVHFPIVLSLNNKRSIATLSLEFVRIWNILWNRIDELLLLTGADSVLWLDLAQMSYQDAQDLRSSAIKTGWAFFDSQKLQDRSNPMAQKHLTRTQIGDQAQKVQALLAMAGLISQTFGGMIGIGDASVGRAGGYDSNSKLNFQYNQQAAVMQEFWHEDTLFGSEVLQRTSQIQRTVNAKDDWAEVQYSGKGGTRQIGYVKLFEGLADAEPSVNLENAQKLQKIQDNIDSLSLQGLSSGAIGMKQVITGMFANNVQEAVDIYDNGMSTLEEIQARQQQQALAIQQQKIQSDVQKSQIPIQVEQLRGQNELAAIDAKQHGDRAKEDFKGSMADTQEQWTRERQVQGSELEKDRTAFDKNILPAEFQMDEQGQEV